jgi:hypothetical protein
MFLLLTSEPVTSPPSLSAGTPTLPAVFAIRLVQQVISIIIK